MNDSNGNHNKREPKKPFTKEEDELIQKYVQENGLKDLIKLENMLLNRNVKQIRERYRNYLNPEVIQSPFTQEEDDLLVKSYPEYNGKWCEIVKLFPGRTDILLRNDIKNFSEMKGKGFKMKYFAKVKRKYIRITLSLILF